MGKRTKKIELGLTEADIKHIVELASFLNSRKISVAKAAEMVADLSDAMYGRLPKREFKKTREVSKWVMQMSLE